LKFRDLVKSAFAVVTFAWRDRDTFCIAALDGLLAVPALAMNSQ
jgi:hypothetical protein